jgi:serine/threonine-protein kinase
VTEQNPSGDSLDAPALSPDDPRPAPPASESLPSHEKRTIELGPPASGVSQASDLLQLSDPLQARYLPRASDPPASVDPARTSDPSRSSVLPRASDPPRSGGLVRAAEEPAPAIDERTGTGGSLATDADPLIGFVVGGRYRILERLGRGGMGMVYKVQHVRLSKMLALKLLAGELAREPDVVRRFRREADLASRLSHPNTVHVFDYGVSDGLTWLVMELVLGVDLSRLIKLEGPLPWPRAIKIVTQVCSSLAEAHHLGIVHRDVKPGNIMVTRSREGEDIAKVLDFGLAKLREGPEQNEVTTRGTVLGTPHYMAPEQILGKPIDGRADIYALGAVLYRLVTRQPVFTGSAIQVIFDGHLHQRPIPPEQRAPEQHIPLALSRIILKALEKSPGKRQARVEDLREELLGVLADEAGPDSLSDRSIPIPLLHPENATRDEVAAFERKLRRQRWVTRGATALALAGLGYGLFAGYRAFLTPGFDGEEVEPNQLARQANDLPFGRTVSAHIGQRLDPEHPDVDFYRITIPPQTGAVSLRLTSLPNMSLCALLYPQGEIDPLARLCPGAPRLDLIVPKYRLTEGTYLLAITQDRSPPPGRRAPFPVVENVSDAYHLTIERSHDPPDEESEPNDAPSTADLLEAGATLRGRLGWVDDIDTVCAQGTRGQRMRWSIGEGSPQMTRGAVLEVTPIVRGEAGPATRLRPPGDPDSKPTDADARMPWKSPFVPLGKAPRTTCVRLRRATDPVLREDSPSSPGVDRWTVRWEVVDAPE